VARRCPGSRLFRSAGNRRRQILTTQTKPDLPLIYACARLLEASKGTRAEPRICDLVIALCTPQLLIEPPTREMPR
jgi:hypothetical protein